MNLKKIWLKLTNKKNYLQYKFDKAKIAKQDLFENKIKNFLYEVDKKLKSNDEISFLHSGHAGDLVNSLPLVKEISKTKKCNFYVESEKKLPSYINDNSHPYGNFYLTKKTVKMILPLLQSQSYISVSEEFKDQEIDINLNFFRELPVNFNIDIIRLYSHLTGIHPDLQKPYIETNDHKSLQNKIVIIRSLRRQSPFINYKFLKNYKDIFFVGLRNEFLDLKKDIPNLNFYDCKDFLEMAEIIKSCKIFIGNLSLGYHLAEGLKVPRLLETNPEFPLVYPNGGKGYDFYFQIHFEKIFQQLISRE